MKNNFELLIDKDIISILDGDTEYGKYIFEDRTTIEIRMPYLTGPAICSISNHFGLHQEYATGKDVYSRWEYFKHLLEHCVKENRGSDLLAYLFSINQFKEKIKDRRPEEVHAAHDAIVSATIDKINGMLAFGCHQLRSVGSRFEIVKVGSSAEIQAPKIKTVDRDYIRSISGRAQNDVQQGDYDSAVTKSRTLLEEVFCYVIEKKNEVPSDRGEIDKLFRQVKDLYNMHTDSATDKRISKLLSGMYSIISAIAEMRNKGSDAHGVGAKRIGIKEYHARLIVNSAIALADFILSVQENNP